MALVKQKHLNLYKKYTEQLISDLGSTLTIFLKSSSQKCNNCVWDNINNCSSGKYNGTGPSPFDGFMCPVCEGSGYIKSQSSVNINAICRWVNPSKNDDKYSKEEFGLDEKNYLKIKAKIMYYDYINNADYFIYDGERYRLKTQVLKRGMKTNVVCVAFLEKENV